MPKFSQEEMSAENLRAARAALDVLKQKAGNRYLVLVAVDLDDETHLTPLAADLAGERYDRAKRLAVTIGMLIENIERAEAATRPTLPPADGNKPEPN